MTHATTDIYIFTPYNLGQLNLSINFAEQTALQRPGHGHKEGGMLTDITKSVYLTLFSWRSETWKISKLESGTETVVDALCGYDRIVMADTWVQVNWRSFIFRVRPLHLSVLLRWAVPGPLNVRTDRKYGSHAFFVLFFGQWGEPGGLVLINEQVSAVWQLGWKSLQISQPHRPDIRPRRQNVCSLSIKTWN